ncbi:serine acetyltransferase, plasmid (SAT) [Treponema primitia ZAS-2]|uniref:Serine acetyltransferase n=1 Tax=Treponema primitia (strain ATCC BAA-887 / DSM 12427 / ZAS-2) TaxID=545694 RepID=F5YR21_TREPZ|nr:serine O-acetyltransferase EpsC [Treponema primitia]AEF85146.1 serine acetyltransferase, plasmid (SAT) [Treponema primitia ZAS-2]
MRRLHKSIETLTSSYDLYGLVNHAGRDNLPSRDSIDHILQGLDELVFPGFREYGALDHDNLQLITAEKVYHLARELVGEVEKSIAFSSRQGDANCGNDGCHAAAELIVDDFFDELPKIRGILATDLNAAFDGDPAAKSAAEVILSYPGFEAIMVHRIAHFFWTREVPLIPRIMSELTHGATGIDIHPGAEIGESFFIDHGTGVVIGETCMIGRNVKLYQGVTLGALSVKKEEANRKRHPTIEDDVTIYSGATILGGDTIIGRGSTIGGNVWITESVPAGAMVYTTSGDQVVRTV